MNNSLPPTTSALPADAVPAGLTRLGHYELLDCIGRGGMGLVYRARDTRLDRQVAIKCLRTELFEAHYVERFKREALLLAKLNHPNIVQIYDFIEAPDQLALVMELVEGQNLQLHLREHIVPFSQRMRWLTEIAQGLAVAHDAGIIHRDLKAENILINQRKVAKITDLGIAKSQDFNATLTDHIAGSYCSMSPEQAMGEAIDFKSDLFSFGILAYQLLCGAHPFGDTNNKLQLMQRIISHPPIAPGKHNPDLPAEINDLLGQLLSKDPTKRPDNTHWVAAQLETLSHLQPANDFVSDDTQVLIPNGDAANQSNVKNTGIHSAVRTQDHPTFETRFVAINAAPKKSHWLPIKNYLFENKISVGFGLFSVLILAAVVIWQLQPKPPKYIAVIPPKLTSEGMQESQQELVKGTVYDAIQQSVIQLDGYYLIPSSEIADVNGDNETVRRATAADELITAKIQCKIESCTITLVRLAPENELAESRLRVEDTKTIDILTDNYLSMAEIITANIGGFYTNNKIHTTTFQSDEDYLKIITISADYRKNGASEAALFQLDQISSEAKKTLALQSLYREITLDLYHQKSNSLYLQKLERLLDSYPNKTTDIGYLTNLYYLQVALNQGNETVTEKMLANLNAGSAFLHELRAYKLLRGKNFEAAIVQYKKSLSSKVTANNLFYVASAYWQIGDTNSAKDYLAKTTSLSPHHYEAHSLYGIIWLTEGNIQNAIDSFQIVIEKNPDDAYNLGNLGLSYLLNKEYKLATKTFEKAIQLSPENPPLLLNRADAEQLSGNIANAELLYKKACKLAERDMASSENLQLLAQAQAHLGNYSSALTHLKNLERRDPSGIGTIYSAAVVNTLASNNVSALLSIENSLTAGINIKWFTFPWFDRLCKVEEFGLLMEKYGEANRCLSNNLMDGEEG
jgi:serine/threonine protein kinase/tetratricopeptide (TPR) repeat protein